MKRYFLAIAGFLALAGLAGYAGRSARPKNESLKVVVTTSLLESLAIGLLPPGDPPSVRFLRIIPPGACPGHFDPPVGLAEELSQARLLLRHDFQAGLHDRLVALAGGQLKVAVIPSGGSALIPSQFRALAAQVKNALAGILPPSQFEIMAAGERAIIEWSLGVERDLQAQMASYRGWPILADERQRAFCQWLGFEVKGVFGRGEELSPGQIASCLQAKVRFIAGNLQSGARAAEVLGERMGLPVAILSNFPGAEGFGQGYKAWMENNWNRIKAAGEKALSN